VTVHVDGFKDALREVLFLRRRQLGYDKSQENGQLFPVRIGLGQDRGEKSVASRQTL
jgi:hypothetical protein